MNAIQRCFVNSSKCLDCRAQVEWNNPGDLTKGFKYIYLSDADYSSIAARADTAFSQIQDLIGHKRNQRRHHNRHATRQQSCHIAWVQTGSTQPYKKEPH